MTEAPSIKEALEPCPFCGKRPVLLAVTESDNFVRHYQIRCDNCRISLTDDYEGGTVKLWNTRATFQPGGERRETIARIIDPRSHQKYDDAYRRKDRHDQMVWIGGVNKARKKADRVLAILASGLVQNEAGEKVTLLLRMIDAAGGEIDATENVHSLLNYFCDDRGSATDTYNLAIDQGLIGSSFDSMFETSRAWLTYAGRAAIRSARDGGAET